MNRRSHQIKTVNRNHIRLMRALNAVILAVLLVASDALGAEQETQRATLVVHGRIWTANRNQPWAEAIAVRGERIVAVGSRDEIARLTDDDTETVDAGDGLVVPGLIDSHIHLVDGGLQLTRVQLRDAARNGHVDGR